MQARRYNMFPWPLNLWSLVFQRPVSAEELPADWEVALALACSTLKGSDSKELLESYFRDGVLLGALSRLRFMVTELRHPYRMYCLMYGTSQNDVEISGKPIDALSLSTRTYHGLRRAGIETINQLTHYTEQELMSIRNMGVASVEEIKSVLAAYDLSLRTESEKKEEKEKIPLLERAIDTLELSPWTYNQLRRVGIKTIGQLVSYTERELFNMPGVGKGMVCDINEKLAANDLALKIEVEKGKENKKKRKRKKDPQ